jgi:hypothetical protein
MRILLITEGIYPYAQSGASLWCDQIIRGMPDHRFRVLSLVGPTPQRILYELPAQVEALDSVHLHSRRPGVGRSNPVQVQAFYGFLDSILAFVRGDLKTFAQGLVGMSALGDEVDLLPLLARRRSWAQVQQMLARLLGREPKLAEVAQVQSWLAASLVPVLFTPPRADLVHTTASGMAGVLAWLGAHLYQVPLVVSEYNIHLRERYLAFPVEGNSYALKLFRSRFYRSIARLVYRQADRTVALSQTARQWQLRLGAAPERCRVIALGSATAAPPPQEALTPLSLVWVGKPRPETLDLLLAVLRRVRGRIPEVEFQLVPLKSPEVPLDYAMMEARLETLRLNVRWSDPVTRPENAFAEGEVVMQTDAEGRFWLGMPQKVGTLEFVPLPSEPRQMTEEVLKPLRRIQRRNTRIAQQYTPFSVQDMQVAYRNLYAEVLGLYDASITLFDPMQQLEDLEPIQLEETEDLFDEADLPEEGAEELPEDEDEPDPWDLSKR